VKRRKLVKHLTQHGAAFLREGSDHTVYRKADLQTSIPRHPEIHPRLVRKICNDLQIPVPRER
jgi:predicted RNA binding protein YcfA (HicA-like mRNA interferase family)